MNGFFEKRTTSILIDDIDQCIKFSLRGKEICKEYDDPDSIKMVNHYASYDNYNRRMNRLNKDIVDKGIGIAPYRSDMNIDDICLCRVFILDNKVKWICPKHGYKEMTI